MRWVFRCTRCLEGPQYTLKPRSEASDAVRQRSSTDCLAARPADSEMTWTAVGVLVGAIGVVVRVGVFVGAGVLVDVGVLVGVGVLVDVGVLVGAGVLVDVGVFVGPGVVVGVGVPWRGTSAAAVV